MSKLIEVSAEIMEYAIDRINPNCMQWGYLFEFPYNNPHDTVRMRPAFEGACQLGRIPLFFLERWM